MTNKNIIAGLFTWVREVIESAETPFVLLALVVLPVLAPLVPATVTGIRLHNELDFHPIIATISAVVLELLGYVGAIAFIKSIYRLRRKGSFLSVIMNGVAYGFYVVAMYWINVKLGFLAGESSIVNEVFAILSFLTVPTGLLAAEHVNERFQQEEEEKKRKEEEERKERIRQEERADRMERYRIKNQGVESSRKVSNGNGKNEESFQKVSDWRKVRPTLSREDLERLASLTPAQMQEYAERSHLTYKTISNWRRNARTELQLD